MKTAVHFLITPRSVILRMRNVSDKSCTGNQNRLFAFSILYRLRYNLETYCRGGQVTNDNMVHARGMLDN